MKKILYITLISSLIISSCQKEEQIGGTAIKDMSSEWFVQINGEGDYAHFSTYNTAANSSTEMWLDDLESFYEMKGKVNVNLPDRTFSGSNIPNEYYDMNFTVTEGKILKDAAKAPGSKTVTDSIYFKVTFSDDDPVGTVYTISGYKRTGFAEDEH